MSGSADRTTASPVSGQSRGRDAGRVASLDRLTRERQDKAQFGEAAQSAREILEIRRRVQGEKHWETIDTKIWAETMARAATLPRDDQMKLAAQLSDAPTKLHEQGRDAEAEPINREALAVISRLLGSDHPYVAEAAARVGLNLAGQGKYAEAADLHRKALEICRRARRGKSQDRQQLRQPR